MILSTRYDPDIDGLVPPRAAAKAKEQQARAENEAEAGDAGDVNSKDVSVMYLVMRERVAKMEARVDERLNQVRAEYASRPKNMKPDIFCGRWKRCCARRCCRWPSRWTSSCSRVWTRCRPAHVDGSGCLGKYRRCFDDGSQAAARAVKESVASMGGARDARAVMAAKQVTCCCFQKLRAM
jgi:hypothetical protein